MADAYDAGALGEGGLEQEAGVGHGGGRRLGGEQLLLRDAKVFTEADVERHFGVERLVEQPGEPSHVFEAFGLGRRERDGAAEVHQEEVVLPHVVLEPLKRERAVADAGDERVGVFLVPDVRVVAS